jgi:hypothetical protein
MWLTSRALVWRSWTPSAAVTAWRAEERASLRQVARLRRSVAMVACLGSSGRGRTHPHFTQDDNETASHWLPLLLVSWCRAVPARLPLVMMAAACSTTAAAPAPVVAAVLLAAAPGRAVAVSSSPTVGNASRPGSRVSPAKIAVGARVRTRCAPRRRSVAAPGGAAPSTAIAAMPTAFRASAVQRRARLKARPASRAPRAAPACAVPTPARRSPVAAARSSARPAASTASAARRSAAQAGARRRITASRTVTGAVRTANAAVLRAA